ncbi:MAG: GAK system CofD-like protein [Candidatus Wallbacteria bacterium]|nr:GAK system CofD-like protein [Candidatus Wallbacteria bacterium]
MSLNAPDSGPRILFFSGGSALRELSRELIRHTSNSIHLVTPFDSGGSSAEISRAFDLFSVGDLRNRLMALADPNQTGRKDIHSLFTHRFHKKSDNAVLLNELYLAASGKAESLSRVPAGAARVIRGFLKSFLKYMPADFDLRGASVGNLILTGGLLAGNRRVGPVIKRVSALAGTKGIVRPVCNRHLQLAAVLESGELIVGQHLLTGKEVPPLSVPVSEIFLVKSTESPTRVLPFISPYVRSLIRSADLIIFPFGSFYTSLLACLLVAGVGRAVASNPCPKVFIPNPYDDPEQLGLSLTQSVKVLKNCLQRDLPPSRYGSRVLDTVLIDQERGDYRGAIDALEFSASGVKLQNIRLITEKSKPGFDPSLMAKVLMEMAGQSSPSSFCLSS